MLLCTSTPMKTALATTTSPKPRSNLHPPPEKFPRALARKRGGVGRKNCPRARGPRVLAFFYGLREALATGDLQDVHKNRFCVVRYIYIYTYIYIYIV